MRYVTPETVSSSNTTPQLANMLGTANKVREQITGVKKVSGDHGGGRCSTSSPSKHRMMLDTANSFPVLWEENHSKQEHK